MSTYVVQLLEDRRWCLEPIWHGGVRDGVRPEVATLDDAVAWLLGA